MQSVKGDLKMKKRMILTMILAITIVSLTGAMLVPAAETADQEPAENAAVKAEKVLNPDELFTNRDLKQEPDLSDAQEIEVKDGDEIRITEEGIYILRGKAVNAAIYVEADGGAKIQLVLDGLDIESAGKPCISVADADKVFITTISDSSLSVTEDFSEDADGKGAIYSKTDLVLNGTATLTINSPNSGIICKDDLKITGGTYVIDADTKAISANDSIRIAGGSFTVNAGTDALHAENTKNDALGYIYISGGDFEFNVGDDAIHATSVVQIDGGSFTITGAEGIEGTYIQINDGSLLIHGIDDGINAANKSSAYTATFEMNGGELTITSQSNHTDGIDSNGDMYINGGTIDITAKKPFDCSGILQHNGGTVMINGEPME